MEMRWRWPDDHRGAPECWNTWGTKKRIGWSNLSQASVQVVRTLINSTLTKHESQCDASRICLSEFSPRQQSPSPARIQQSFCFSFSQPEPRQFWAEAQSLCQTIFITGAAQLIVEKSWYRFIGAQKEMAGDRLAILLVRRIRDRKFRTKMWGGKKSYSPEIPSGDGASNVVVLAFKLKVSVKNCVRLHRLFKASKGVRCKTLENRNCENIVISTLKEKNLDLAFSSRTALVVAMDTACLHHRICNTTFNI